MFTENNPTSGSVTGTVNTIENTSNIPSSRNYSVYFDPKQGTNYGNSLAIAFNQAPAASYKYTLVSVNGAKYDNDKTISNAIVFRNLPTAPSTWNRDGTFSATLNSELLFNPDTYENPLTKYEHGYTEGQTTSTGTPISTGDKWESIFAPSASGTPSGTYYLTNNIVINGFTGKTMSGVTIDGNGKTIFVIGATQSSYSGTYVGGLVGDFTGGTIKNVRVVYLSLAGEISFTMSTERGGRVGLLAGRITNSIIENVQVRVDEGVTVNATASSDTQFAMGGLIGEAATGSSITGATVDLNGELNPSGKWQFLGGIVGVVQSANTSGTSPTVKMQNIIIRGAGTLSGNALNNNQPTFTAAVAVLMPTTGAVPAVPFVTIDGLIYDFKVTLNGKLNGTGGTGKQYACYYLFTYNYNDYRDDGWQPNSPIEAYNEAVEYNNVFIASDYIVELEGDEDQSGYAEQRTNGNAAVGIGNDTTIKAIAGEVTGVSGATVTAYFVPTGNNSDITLAASQPSGGWGGVSQLKSDGDSSARSVDDGDMKVVTVAKANAATADNKVTLSEYVPGTVVTVTGVATQLVYNAAEQGATFTFEGGSPELTTHYSVVYAVNAEDPKGAQLGDTGLPLNAGNYTATITLNEDGGFVFKSADGGYTRQTTFEFAVNPYELTLQSGIATALAGTYGDYTVTSGAVSGDKINSLTQETLFGSSVPGTVAYTVTVADQNDGLLNASTYSFTAGVSDTNYNLASGAIDGVVVSPYRVEGTWALDGGLTLAYGDPVPSNIDQYISVSLTTSDIPGGLTSVAASGFTTDYTQGTAAGETVNINAGTYSVDSGLASNYNFDGITGSGSVQVQKKTLTIDPVSEEPDYMYDPHISAVYGATGDKAAVQGLLTWNTIGSSITGNYNGEEVSFTIDKIYIAATDEESGEFTLVGAEEVADENIASLKANSYLITVTANSSNYTVAEGQFFVYGVTPVTLTVTGVTFEGDFDGVYDGQAHGVEVQFSGLLVGDDSYNFAISISGVEGTSVTDAGTYTVTVAADESNLNYDLSLSSADGEYTITIDRYDLADAKVTIAESDLVYTGSAITVTPIVKGGENDFTSKLTVVVNGGAAVVNAGEYTITASDTKNSGNFTGEASGKFEVAQKQLKLQSLTLSSSTYTGEPITVTGHNFADGYGPVGDEQPELVIAPQGSDPVVNAGEYTFNVSLATDNEVNKNYVMAEGAGTITATVSPATVTVTAGKNAELGALYGESATAKTSRFYESDFITFDPAKPDGTFTLADALTFTVTNSSGPVSPVGDKYTLAPGTYTVTYTIKDVENANYTLTAGDTLTTTLTVKEGALKLTITGWNNTSATYDGMAQLPTPVFADSAEIGEKIEEGALVYEVTANAGSSLTGSDAVNAGSYTVTVSVAAGFEQKYELVGGELSTDFTIAPATLNITQTAEETLTRPYDGTTTEATSFLTEKYVTITGGVSGENIYGMLNASLTEGGEIKNAGAYTITVTFNAEAEGAGNYSVGKFTSLEIVYTVTAKTITITFDGYEGLTYNGQARTLTATADFVSGESIDLNALIAYTGDITNGEAVNAGSYTATITKAQIEKSNANYTLAAESATQEFTISPATLTLTQTDGAQLSRVYDGTVTEAGAFVSEAYFTVSGYMDGGNEYALFTAAVAEGLTIQNADSYTINITLNSEAEGAGNYVLAEDATVEFTIAPKSIGVAWENTAFTYNGLAQVPTANVGEAQGLVAGDDLQITVSGAETDANTDGGSYTATAAITGGEDMGNYVLAEDATVEFTIARKTVSVAWENTAFTYNGLAQVPTANVGEAQGLVAGDDLQITVSGAETDANTDGGSYTATAEITGGEDMGNYVLAEDATVEFTIARKALTVLGGTAEFDFGVIGETTNTYKEQIASWDDAKNKVITGFFGNDTYTLGDIKTADAIQEVVYTDGKLNAGSYYVSYTVGDNYTIGGGQTGLIRLTVNKLSYEISLTYTIDSAEESAWGGNISFEHDAPITLTFNDNALEITFNDGSEHKHVVTVNDGTLPNVTFKLGGITINESNKTTTISSVQSMNVTAQITPDDETNYEFTGTTSFNFTVKRNTRVEANEKYFSGLDIPSEYTGRSIPVADISATDAFTVTLGGVVQSGAEVSIAAKLNGKQTDSICDAGDYVITATYTTENDEVVTGTYEFTVAKAELSFTLESAPAIVYGEMSADVMPEALKAFTATGVKGKSVAGTFAITVGLNENIYSGAGFVKAGSYDFTITFTPDDDNYAELVYNSADDAVKLTVAQKTITPSAISYGEVTSVDKTLTLNYAGKSAYDGNLAIATDDILSSDAGSDVVEFISEKDYSAANEEGYTLEDVKIGDAGDGGNYKLDLSGWKVVVLKKTIEVTVTAENDTYTGSAIKLTAASEEVVTGDTVTFTVSGKNVTTDQTVTNAGTYALTVTLGGEQGGNYEVAGEHSVTIGKAIVNIVWTNEDELKAAVYNGQPYEATADVMFNGQSVGSASIKYTSDEVTVTDGKAVNAGRYTATATFAETDNFNAASEDYDFTIAKMVLDGEWKVASMDMTYDGTSKAGYATWTWTTAAPLNEGDVTVGYKYELNGAIVDDVIDAGNYNVYAVFTDNTGNYDTESGILQGNRFDALTVARRAVRVEWSERVSFTYNGAEQAPTATALNVAQGDSLTLTVTGAKKDVGTYTATVAAASVTGNYVLAEDATVGFTITPKPIDVAWSNTEFTYDGTAHKPTATATGWQNGENHDSTLNGLITIGGNDTQALNAGDYTATITKEALEAALGNYTLAEESATKAFTIAKADLTVTPASLEIRERETDVMQAFAEGADLAEAFAGRISVSGVSGTVSYTVTIAGDNNYDDDGLLTVGAHTFTIDAGGNYNAASVSVTVIATPVVTVIASVEGELVYNGSAFEISYALKEGAPEDVSMDDITVTPSVETIVNAGEYEVTFTVTGSNEDYDYVVQDASGNAALTFTIAKRGLDVAEVAEAVYGDLQVSGTLVTGTHTAFVAYNDEEIELIVNVKTAALSRAAAEYLDAGEYEVTIALVSENGNFSLNGATLNAETKRMEVQSTLDVAPKTVEVGYTTSSGVYDAKGISITLDKFEDMLIEGDDPAVNIYINDAPYTGRVVLDAGEYTVRYESADPNYAFTPVSATFTVAPKSVTPNFDLNTGSGSLQITGGGKLEIEEGEETDIVAAIDNFMQSSGVSEEEMSIAVSGDLKLEDMATWAPGTYTVTVTLSGNHSGSMQFTVEVSEKIELPPPVQPELPENPAEAGSGNDWVLPLVIAIVALIDLALLVAIGVAAKKRA